MNPADLLSRRHRELQEARERVAKIQRTIELERERQAELRREVGAAELRDRAALGEALVDGHAEPAREADLLRADVDQGERRLEALLDALSTAQAAVAGVVRQNPSWSRDQWREVARARDRYAAAITELEQARDVFSDEVGAQRRRSTSTRSSPAS